MNWGKSKNSFNLISFIWIKFPLSTNKQVPAFDTCWYSFNQNYVIDVEIAEQSSESETTNDSCCSKTVSINKEEHDKQCAKYSTASFLLGICGIVIWGISNLKPQQ